MKKLLLLSLIMMACKGTQVVTENNAPAEVDVNPININELPSVKAVELTSTENENINKMNTFGLKTAKELQPAAEAMESTVLSPISIGYALGMLAEGATNETLAELEGALGMSKTEATILFNKMMQNGVATDPDVKVKIANMVAVNKAFKLLESYQDTLRNQYFAMVSNLDFASPQAQQTLDEWCNKNTNGLIPESPIKIQSTDMATLMNAIYFKGGWTEIFNYTQEERFTNADGKQVAVPMMIQTGYFGHLKRNNYAMARMNYGDCKYSMVVILPDEGTTTVDMLRQMTAEQWVKDFNDMGGRKVYLGLPRFEISQTTDLEKALQKLNIQRTFTSAAQFDNMTQVPVYVSKIVQKARIKVDEKGTEAAAVTQAAIALGSALDPEPVLITDFYANRPFIYTIVDNRTKAILFLGEYRGEVNGKPKTDTDYDPDYHQRAYEEDHRQWELRHRRTNNKQPLF